MKYIDREGKTEISESVQDKVLNYLYTHTTGRIFLKILVHPAISKAVGRLLNTRASGALILPFVKANGIDMSLYEKGPFRSYNHFFKRRIRPGGRPFSPDRNILISPCDGKLSIYPIDKHTHFKIKHTYYTVESLVRSKKIAKHYREGYACVFRLTVDDYHHYCYPVDGEKSANYSIRGVLHTVNPIANDHFPIYKENAREFCLLKSSDFGTLLLMEVGAMMVGKINNYHGRRKVKKGQEKGCFEFGGSTVVMLIQKDKVALDEDLLENTKKGFETIVRMGERIGKKK